MLRQILVRFALKILRTEVQDKIQYAPVQSFTGATFNMIEKISMIVTDSDKDNKAQLQQLWLESRKEVVLGLTEVTKNVIEEEVEKKALKTILVELLEELATEIRSGNFLKKLTPAEA